MKKGFTLIELLAVILILGIISLIAIPKVTDVIEDAKKGAAETSAEALFQSCGIPPFSRDDCPSHFIRRQMKGKGNGNRIIFYLRYSGGIRRIRIIIARECLQSQIYSIFRQTKSST